MEPVLPKAIVVPTGIVCLTRPFGASRFHGSALKREFLMSYLDVSPLVTALRTSPDTFEFTRGSLHHIPSRHRFKFDPQGGVRLDAHCSCSFLSIRKEQEASLHEAFQEWRVNYWRPIEINREFAAHFAPPSAWRRFLIALTARLHRALLRQPSRDHAYKDHLAVPAE